MDNNEYSKKEKIIKKLSMQYLNIVYNHQRKYWAEATRVDDAQYYATLENIGQAQHSTHLHQAIGSYIELFVYYFGDQKVSPVNTDCQ